MSNDTLVSPPLDVQWLNASLDQLFHGIKTARVLTFSAQIPTLFVFADQRRFPAAPPKTSKRKEGELERRRGPDES